MNFNEKEIRNMLQITNKGSINLDEFEEYMFKRVWAFTPKNKLFCY